MYFKLIGWRILFSIFITFHRFHQLHAQIHQTSYKCQQILSEIQHHLPKKSSSVKRN